MLQQHCSVPRAAMTCRGARVCGCWHWPWPHCALQCNHRVSYRPLIATKTPIATTVAHGVTLGTMTSRFFCRDVTSAPGQHDLAPYINIMLIYFPLNWYPSRMCLVTMGYTPTHDLGAKHKSYSGSTEAIRPL